MKRMLPIVLIATLVALAPAISAAPEDEPTDGGNAWTEDCPPDRFCAYSEGGGTSIDEEGAEPVRTPDGEDCENCRGPTAEETDAEMPMNDCVEDDSGATVCHETTDYDPQIAETAGPTSDDSGAEVTAESANEVPAAGVALALVGVLGAALFVARRRN